MIAYQYFDFAFNMQPYNLDSILNLNFSIILYKLKFILSFFFYYSFINVFLVSGIIILFTLNFQRKIDNYTKLLNYYFIFSIMFIFGAYLFRDMEVEYAVRTTMERIIFTSSGFYVFLVVNFFKNLNNICDLKNLRILNLGWNENINLDKLNLLKNIEELNLEQCDIQNLNNIC